MDVAVRAEWKSKKAKDWQGPSICLRTEEAMKRDSETNGRLPWDIPQRSEKETAGTGNQRNNRSHTDHVTININ